MTKVAIDSIVVNDRIRKDFGDIEQLAEDIKANGLIQPIVVSKDLVLLCGERRLRACQAIGLKEVDVVVKEAADAHEALVMEISENENRKPFTVSERLAYAAKLIPVAKEEAKERQSGERSRRESKGKVRDLVAKDVGFGSGKTFERAKAVSESGQSDLVEAMDSGEMSIRAAYDELQKRVKDQQALIDEQNETIKAYEQAEDEQSDAYEALAQKYMDIQQKLRAAEASSDYHNRDAIVQNTIDQLTSQRDEAINQRDKALDELDKRVRPLMTKDPAAAAYVALGGVLADAPEDRRKEIAKIVEAAVAEIEKLCA